MYNRLLKLQDDLAEKSLFLFGPRLTGKSTLLHSEFPQANYIDLLESEVFRTLATNPEHLRSIAESSKQKVIIIDEIQKIPELLDEVHRLIERDKKIRFILTGSSPRKIKRAGGNMLGGRARIHNLFPLVFPEVQPEISSESFIQTMTQWGGLPSILEAEAKKKNLNDYITGYLQDEVQSESIVRSLPSFLRFLTSAATMNTEQVDFTAVASDAQIQVKMVKEYFQILEDTLFGSLLPAYRKGITRKAMVTPKFFLFDTGVANALLNRWSIQPGTPEYGTSFEHFIWRELASAIAYKQSEFQMHYWRTTSQMEVDFVLDLPGAPGPLIAIEAKGKNVVTSRDYKGLAALAQDFPKVRKILVCSEKIPRKTPEGIDIWPVKHFLQELWHETLLKT